MSRRLALTALGLALLGGCGSGGPELLPVTGRVTADGRPLTRGTVSFRPDAAKGNPSLHHPTGVIGPDGRYELFTTDRAGAPPGWYKVLVFADANATPTAAAHPTPPKWLVAERYTREATTPLSVEVTAGGDPARYDLTLAK